MAPGPGSSVLSLLPGPGRGMALGAERHLAEGALRPTPVLPTPVSPFPSALPTSPGPSASSLFSAACASALDASVLSSLSSDSLSQEGVYLPSPRSLSSSAGGPAQGLWPRLPGQSLLPRFWDSHGRAGGRELWEEVSPEDPWEPVGQCVGLRPLRQWRRLWAAIHRGCTHNGSLVTAKWPSAGRGQTRVIHPTSDASLGHGKGPPTLRVPTAWRGWAGPGEGGSDHTPPQACWGSSPWAGHRSGSAGRAWLPRAWCFSGKRTCLPSG